MLEVTSGKGIVGLHDDYSETGFALLALDVGRHFGQGIVGLRDDYLVQSLPKLGLYSWHSILKVTSDESIVDHGGKKHFSQSCKGQRSHRLKIVSSQQRSLG